MEKGKKKRQIETHDFVKSIINDKYEAPGVRLIRGFVGVSDRSDHLRVYLDIELRRFVDIPADGIIHHVDLRDSGSPLAPVHLWVNEKAAIRHKGNWAANEDPTTMATGEEGGGDPTTMATGEESAGPLNFLDALINPNPFGNY